MAAPVGMPIPVQPVSLAGKKALASLPRNRKDDAVEFVKFARAAIEANDVELAIQRLQSALALMYE